MYFFPAFNRWTLCLFLKGFSEFFYIWGVNPLLNLFIAFITHSFRLWFVFPLSLRRCFGEHAFLTLM